MELHPKVEAYVEFERASEALSLGYTLAALAHLEKALKLHDNPSWYSYLGYCIAKMRGRVKNGIEFCQSSLLLEQAEPAHYLNLGKIHLLSGDRAEALRVFREGLIKGENHEIRLILDRLGTRKSPVFNSLSRKNPLNRYFGMIFRRIGLR